MSYIPIFVHGFLSKTADKQSTTTKAPSHKTMAEQIYIQRNKDLQDWLIDSKSSS